ncbi:MAG TPA: PKD domain-containing protein, partial [Thermoanaerobaculia bacterium]|nr:PKD domain-containing protein [Thermoanaerobaculia bacterium]
MRLPISSLAALLAFGLGSEIVHATEKGEEGEGAAISERARLELKARGGAPRLSTAASEYGARRAEHARGLRTLALPDAAWVPIGPSSAPGRMTSLAPHPSVSGTLYAGAADGGLFRTTDGGATWTPLTDDVPNLSVGAVALAPSAPATIYLGTGEGGPPASFVPGIGLLKSTDGGATWTLPSAVVARQFFRISVHPSSPNVLVAATGSGGLLSTDGGATFATVIAASQYGVVADLARDASRPETLYAATWCPSGVACARGPARVLKSTDGGVTWAEKGSGLSFTGDADEARVSIAIGRSAPNVLYAARAEGGVAHLYRSDDGAESWSEVAGVGTSGDATVRGYMGGQSWYDNVLAVSPTNADLVFAGGLYTIRSTDGGRGFAHPAFAGAHVHLDVHDLAFQGSTLWVATDGGVFSTSDSGDTARDANASLVTRQYYSVAQHSARPDRLLAGAQDNGTDQRAATAWRSARGGDGFDCAYDALVPDVAWATAEYGRVFRSDASGALDAAFSEVTPRWADLGEAPPFRTVLVADPSRSGRILTGASRIVESTDGGTTWRPLGTAMSDGGTFGSDAVGAIAISKDALLVAKGASVLRSTDGGASYRNASGGLPGANVNGLEIDPRDSRIAWAALAATTGESIWGTTDGGASWLARSGGLPPFAAHVVKADPADASAVYAGTDVGVFRSTDAGTTWARFGSGLPAVSVRSLAISGDGTLVRAATHGRGLYELRTASSAGNAPPVVSILRPSAGASVAGGAPVAFEGTVSDPDGDAVTAFWTFGDTWETVALAGAASHSFREKGVYPVTLTARDAKGALSVASLLVTVTTSALENPDPPRWLVAGMAYADGAGGTFWQSDFSVFNPDPSRSMTLSLAFLDGRSAGSAAPRFVAVTIGPQRTRSFPNVLASAPFSLPKGSFGALLVRGDVLPAQPVLNGRTYNAGSGSAGTFGLSVPAVPIPSGLTAQAAGGPPPTLIGLREAPGIAHTNLVLANLGSDPASVQISFVDAKGAALGTPL